MCLLAACDWARPPRLRFGVRVLIPKDQEHGPARSWPALASGLRSDSLRVRLSAHHHQSLARPCRSNAESAKQVK